MKKDFGALPSGERASLYTISCGNFTATVTDYGACLVSLWVPDRNGELADVVLGYDDVSGYVRGEAFFGAPVGRNANRIQGASVEISGKVYSLPVNENGNSLHSGPDFYNRRLWQVLNADAQSVTFRLLSPDGDQGFPGNADIRITYAMEADGLRICYDAVSDKDTVFNFTNHSFFNLAGHDRPEKAMEQTLCLPARYFTVADAESIPTGEERNVDGTPMDFRVPKPLAQDADADYAPLHLQQGYDHNFEVFCNPCAILRDPQSGRTLSICTDLPGIQLYAANFTHEIGKGGTVLEPHCGIALETQYYPDSVHKPQWKQPFFKAGEPYHSETRYHFSW